MQPNLDFLRVRGSEIVTGFSVIERSYNSQGGLFPTE